ncbi:MAG: hypothetical protein KF799_03050 [Bdellovibrionales bacterium]|nr:hypothetical protein [Bdellovibrionales bacterium]
MYDLIKILVVVLFSLSAFAQEPVSPSPLTFQTWKDQQVLEAQNQVLRISARMSFLKSSKSSGSVKEPSHIANGKLRKISDTDTMATAEQDLKRAQESLAAANALQFEDYVDVYIPTLANQPEALQKLSDRLSKEELAEIFKGIMKGSAASDAKRNAALLEGLNGSSTSKTP